MMDETNDRMINQDIIDDELMNELKKANNQTYYLGDNRDKSDSEDEFKNEVESGVRKIENNNISNQKNVVSINENDERETDEEHTQNKIKNDSDDSEDEKDCRVNSQENRNIINNSYLKISKKNNKEYAFYDYEADSKDCENGTSNTPSKILDNLTKASFSSYLEQELVQRRTIFYCLFKSNENIMKWQANIIKKSLTNISEDYQPYVTQLFKNLLGYLGLLKSPKQPLDHIKKLLKNAFISTQEIKDEVYLHCWKQLSGHENNTYNTGIKAWKALAVISSCIFPSSKLLFPLLNQLLFEIKSNEDVNTMRHANYVFARLQRTHEKVRKQIPTDREIGFIEKLSSIPINVHLFSGEEVIVPAESYTTIKELKNSVLRKMGFNMHKSIHYGISEIQMKNSKTLESFIEEDVLICDLLSIWENDVQESFKKRESIEFKLFLREKISFKSTDDETINFRYHQITFDYLYGKYNVDSDKIIALASVKLSIEYPNSNDSASAFKSLNDNFKMYVPENFDDSFKDEICQRIMELYINLSSKSGLKLHFIQELASNEFYDSYNFEVSFSSKNEQLGISLPKDLILSIKPDRLCLYDTEMNLLKTYMYNKIINWGISSIYFVFVIPEEDELLTKMYIETNQSKIIHNLIETNVNLLCERPVKEIEKILTSSEEKFSCLFSFKENTH